jgi:hypothetical protein
MRVPPKTPAFKEAMRYLANAEELLRTKAGRANGNYEDMKYVKMAGNTAWSGVLVAVDEYLSKRGVKKTKGRKSKEWYTEHLSRFNRKLNTAFHNAYSGLHLAVGYDGLLNVKAVREFLEKGKRVIALCERG